MKHSLFGLALVALGTALSVASCFPEPSGLDLGAGGSAGFMASGGSPTSSDAGSSGEAPVCAPRPLMAGAQCHPALSADPLAGRVVGGKAQDRTVFASQLYTTMKSYCGGCHVDNSLGNFHFTSGSFATAVDAKALAAIQSDVEVCALDGSGNKVDPNCYDFMPPAPTGKKWSERQTDPGDPLKPMVVLLKEWIDQGRGDTFKDAAVEGQMAPYAVSQELASSLTNIGSCVPDPGMVATDPLGCDADARFAAMEAKPTGSLVERIGLPPTLDLTDLTSYDSSVLAKSGVVGYVPAYPLWTDDAGKLRLVRVPYGQSISFNKKTKQFDIPANTRFYKTFMKKVKGVDGVVRYRKIETRVIVSRPRDASGKDQAIFGTYEWNDDETQASLLTDPQNDGAPFVDKVKPIIIDEGVAAQVQALVAKGKVRNFSYEMDSRHATRRYAFPSHARCIQCHMGSPSESFILGFTPLQLNTRPCAPETIASDGHCDAGQVEPASGDELTQVDRLSSYGVISGYGSANLVKLEDPQGTSKAPRNVRTTQELVAQGYMLGNCSHCHNPNGYPSVEHPELKPLLNFLPSSVGGIFEFPLERYSPRIFRNVSGDGPIPYITPSLRDRFGDTAHGWKPKAVRQAAMAGGQSTYAFIDAPWRSLIYRNVDTPFTYTDDSAIYPHMPLNSPGFDCRAPRILGEWMVSVPALPKHPNLSEDVEVGVSAVPEFTELDPQPYREVKKADADYLQGVDQANKRLAQYRAGLRDNNYCPDTSDIVDLNVERSNNVQLIPGDGEVSGLPIENVPDRPHWVSIDLTNPPGPWNPRRPDWNDIITNQDFSKLPPPVATEVLDLANQKAVVKLLQGVKYSNSLSDPFYQFATTPVPFGVWQQKPGCNFDNAKYPDGRGIQKAGTISPRPRWMDITDTPADAPVYSAIPGSLIFNMICVNCHGQDADSGGRQAQTLAEMTGGTARVANFRDGFFGPFGSGGTNRKAIFGSDEVAARYLPWMALGGTKVKIPRPILNLVANTPVLGESRKGIEVNTANMLQTAQALCAQIAQIVAPEISIASLAKPDGRSKIHGDLGLITKNGDEELWEQLCTLNNPAPIHAFTIADISDGTHNLQFGAARLYFSSKYPSDPPAPVGDQFGKARPSLTPDNTLPWCVIKPDPSDTGATTWLATQQANGGGSLPTCPDVVVAESNLFSPEKDANGLPIHGDLDDWAARGAINAGQAVFVYLDQMVSQGHGRDLHYDECDQLGK